MLEDHYTTNNNAHLLLYGGAGTGKTLLVSAISSSIATYKFVTGSRF
jgi:DNA replication protein DnaC